MSQPLLTAYLNPDHIFNEEKKKAGEPEIQVEKQSKSFQYKRDEEGFWLLPSQVVTCVIHKF